MRCICFGSHQWPSHLLRLHHDNIIVQCYPPSQNPKYTNGWLWGVFRPGATMGLRSHIPSTRLSLPFPHNSYPSDFNPYQHCTMSSTYCLTFSRKWFYWSKKKVRVWTKFKKLHTPPTAPKCQLFLNEFILSCLPEMYRVNSLCNSCITSALRCKFWVGCCFHSCTLMQFILQVL